MCMISRWIFDCCDREYWTWKPRSCNVPGQRCNRPDRWYMSQTIKMVNIGPCWKCEDARLHRQVFADRKGKKRMLEEYDDEEDDRHPGQKGKGKIREGDDKGEGSSSSWHSIEVVEIEDVSAYATNSASRHVCHHKKENEDQSSAQGSGWCGLRSRSRIEIKRDPSYESVNKSAEASSFAPHALAPNHRNQSRNNWIPINTYAAEPVARPSERQVPATSDADQEPRGGEREPSGTTSNTSSVYAASSNNNTHSCGSKAGQDVVHIGRWTQGAELGEYEQILEQLQMTSQHYGFVSEWEQTGDSPESPGSYVDSVLNTPFVLPLLSLDLSKNEESFTNAPVSDHDTLFAAGQ